MSEPRWPDYMRRETLAARLDLAPGCIDQYVKRGLLPEPMTLGEAKLWYWPAVDNWIRDIGGHGDSQQTGAGDPYMEALDAPAAPNGDAPRSRPLRRLSG